VHLLLRKKIDVYVSIAVAIFGIWLLLVLISPYLVPAGQLNDLSGSVLIMDNPQKIDGINPIAWTVYSLGDANCHQLAERSFFLNDNQMPFCARDIGIFMGVFIGSLFIFLFVLHVKWQWLIIAVAPLVIDGLFQELTSYESSNEVRLLTGLLAGTVGAMFLCEHLAMPIRDKGEQVTESMESSEM